MTTESNTPEYSVSEIAGALKRAVEDQFGHVRVRGEISGLKVAASGHVYLCLKDDKAVLDGVMWKGPAGVLRFRPEDGLEVIATGKLTTYPGRSKYQIVIERMEPAGVGALMALLEQRKAKLAAEGLFAAERKRPLPFLPQVIGVVTSPTGAVIRDILHRLADRFPRRVLVWPVLVQGDGAAAQVTAAIRGFNAMKAHRPDLLIVARGGGSIEDLWAFNEEEVVRAVAESAIPVITAVGHETDTTLVDYASDRRAPTPTAAAEIAVPVRDDLVYTVGDLALRMDRAVAKATTLRAERVAATACRLPSPRELLALKQQRHDELAERLPRALTANIQIHRTHYERSSAALRPVLLKNRARTAEERLKATSFTHFCAYRDRLAAVAKTFDAQACRLRPHMLGNIAAREASRLKTASRLLVSLSYHATLERGYAVVRRPDNGVVTSAAQAAGDLVIEFADGKVEVSAEGAPKLSRPRAPKPAAPAGARQGVLL